MDRCPCDACLAFHVDLDEHMAERVDWELTRLFDPGAGDDRTVWTSVSPGRTLTWEALEQELARLDSASPGRILMAAGRLLNNMPRPAGRILGVDTPQPSHPWDFARARAMLAAGREDDVAAAAAAEVAPVPVDAMPTRPRSFAQWQREAADLLALAERQRR